MQKRKKYPVLARGPFYSKEDLRERESLKQLSRTGSHNDGGKRLRHGNSAERNNRDGDRRPRPPDRNPQRSFPSAKKDDDRKKD